MSISYANARPRSRYERSLFAVPCVIICEARRELHRRKSENKRKFIESSSLSLSLSVRIKFVEIRITYNVCIMIDETYQTRFAVITLNSKLDLEREKTRTYEISITFSLGL